MPVHLSIYTGSRGHLKTDVLSSVVQENEDGNKTVEKRIAVQIQMPRIGTIVYQRLKRKQGQSLTFVKISCKMAYL
jgi:hypothetical protein